MGVEAIGTTVERTSNTQQSPLEQDLTTMLRLEPKCLELGVTLLISQLALAVFLLLQLEDLLEWGLGHGLRDIVLTVKVLQKRMSVRNFEVTYFLLEVRISGVGCTYHFSQQKDVLAAHEEDSARDISVKLSSVDAFNGILKNKVRYEISPTRMRLMVSQCFLKRSFATFIPN
jgi:hypothetical protein